MLRPRDPPTIGGGTTGSPGSESGGNAAGRRSGELMDGLGVGPRGAPGKRDDEGSIAVAELPRGFFGSVLPLAMGLAVGVLVSDEVALFSPDAPETQFLLSFCRPTLYR